jgi:acyl-lipid omega-6 desaturase (Delta-12 desaturase)
LLAPPQAVKKPVARPEWHNDLHQYEKPDVRKAAWQLVNTFVPYAGLWVLMAYMIQQGVSYWLTLPLIVLAAGLLVRIFIFFHDCGHDCFFPSRKANRILGYISGVMTFTPFDDWKQQHAMHHAGAGDLERRGAGDVWTLTVEEYLAAPLRTKIGYRLFRHPFVLLVLGPFFLFFVSQRFAHAQSGPRGRRSVLITNLAILALAVAAAFTIGLRTYLLIQIPVMTVAGACGIWLFYVQHQYEQVYWARHQEWDPIQAALEGSSYYKLPKVLQWFSGNIGLHHIHHLRAHIPNYNLQACYDGVPAMQSVEPLTLWRSFRCLFLHLWDEKDQRMVSFRALKSRMSTQAS